MNDFQQHGSKKATVCIYGLSCSGCVHRIEKHLKDLEGVHTITVNLVTGKAELVFDDEQVGVERVELLSACMIATKNVHCVNVVDIAGNMLSRLHTVCIDYFI